MILFSISIPFSYVKDNDQDTVVVWLHLYELQSLFSTFSLLTRNPRTGAARQPTLCGTSESGFFCG